MIKFIKFLVNTPKASLSALVVAVAQILKYAHILNIPQEGMAQVCDSVSVIVGFIGLYYSAKGEWPKDAVIEAERPKEVEHPVDKIGG